MEARPRDDLIILDGDLDIAHKAQIAHVLSDRRTLESAAIDLSRATYIDSMVLGMLVQFRREFIHHGGRPKNLVLILPKDGPIRKVFEMTGLTGIFEIAHAPRPAR